MLAAFLRGWELDRAGLGSLFYASAVRSMGLSWHHFLYAAYDPAETLTIDKPPLGLWLQVLAARWAGWGPTALHLPSAVAGVVAVPLTFLAARRGLGASTALLAALVLAVFPESVATARDTTMDALVLCLLALGAWLLISAVEGQSVRGLIAWAALMGVLFNVKMFEGFVVLPAALLYVAVRWRVRLRASMGAFATAGAVGVLVGGSWVVAVDLTPAEARPRVMNSESNSAVDLAWRYNGLQRVLPGDVVVFQAPPGAPPPAVARAEASARRFGVGDAGVFRLVRGSNGLLLGSTVLLAVAGAVVALGRQRGWLAGPGLFWLAWGVTGLVLFTASNRAAAHYHESYGPALATLAAVGLVELYRAATRWSALAMPLLVLIVAAHAWYAAQSHPAIEGRINVVVAAMALIGVVALLVSLVPVAHRGAGFVGARFALFPAALAVPLVVSMWIAIEGPSEARAITQPNPLVYASTAPPEPVARLPLEVILALPQREGARYHVALDGIARSGEVIALSGLSVLPLWNEFLRIPVLETAELEAVLAAGDVPWLVLSRGQADSSMLRPVRAAVDAHCSPSGVRALGTAWLLFECAAASR